jgi:RNA polymerase sigma factor (sigma-70 family)
MCRKDYERKSLPELVALFQNGEANAFTELVKRIDGKITGFIHSRMRDIVELPAIKEEDERDIKQEVMLKIVKMLRKKKYSEEGTFIEMVYAITVNSMTDFYKHHHTLVYSPEVMQYAEETMVDETENPDDTEEKEKLHRFFMVALKYLSPQQQAVVLLRTQNELEFKEIGELLHISASDASSIFCKAKKKLIEIVNHLREKREKEKAEKKVEAVVRKTHARVVTTGIRAGK